MGGGGIILQIISGAPTVRKCSGGFFQVFYMFEIR